jgi:cation transport ATPase
MQAKTRPAPWRFDHLFAPLVIFLGLNAATTMAGSSILVTLNALRLAKGKSQ